MQRDLYLVKVRETQWVNGKRRRGRVERLLIPILLLGSVLAALAGMYYLVTSKQLLAVERVVVQGVEHLSPEGVRLVAGILPGENIFTVDLDRARQRLESQAWIASAAVSRQFPSSIVIQVTERKPFAVVELERTHVVDREGVLLQTCDNCASLPFPRVTGVGQGADCSLGAVVPGLTPLLDMVALAQASEFFSRYGLAVLDASNPRQIRLFTLHGEMEVRLGERLTTAQLRDLDGVFRQLPEARRISYIGASGNRRVVVGAM